MKKYGGYRNVSNVSYEQIKYDKWLADKRDPAKRPGPVKRFTQAEIAHMEEIRRRQLLK
jgi:hypothetical protein